MFLALSLEDVGYDSGPSVASGSSLFLPTTNTGIFFFHYYYYDDDTTFQPVTVYYDFPMPMPMIFEPVADNANYRQQPDE